LETKIPRLEVHFWDGSIIHGTAGQKMRDRQAFENPVLAEMWILCLKASVFCVQADLGLPSYSPTYKVSDVGQAS